MPSSKPIPWIDLFATDDPRDVTAEMRVFKKGGKPFLFLPRDSRLAIHALSLYAAQTGFARTAKRVLKMALRMGMPFPGKTIEIGISTQQEFSRFLIQLAGGKSQSFPPLAILSGNPGAEGRRFLLLMFDEQGHPASVVKAGISPAGRRLIQAERSFFQAAENSVQGIPAFRGGFSSNQVEALAVEYIEGEPPMTEDRAVMGRLFGGWLNEGATVRAGDVTVWKELEKLHGADPVFRRIAAKVSDFEFHPTLFHGDFAPWNIKISSKNGEWIVLDWERGDKIGFPGWDWFHYVMQTAILVEKLPAETVFSRVENLLSDKIFQDYAEMAGIRGQEKAMAAAYLFHCVKVIRPGEGLATGKALLALFCDRFV